MLVALFELPNSHRSKLICEAMAAGIRTTGDSAIIRREAEYRAPTTDVAVFYGFIGRLPRILRDHIAAGKKAVYVDLGYWGRHAGGRWHGYHKVAVNARHPTEYFQRHRHGGSRAAALGIFPKPWKKDGDHILLAGMSEKAARSIGMRGEEWERDAIARIRKHTRRPIIYRPKPSWRAAKPIRGVGYSPETQGLDEVLANCHAVVTHHSNVAVDAIIEGVPAFCWDGVAKPLSSQDFSQIETPLRPEGRAQWVADISYVQFSISEMRSGMAWLHLKGEGLIP